MGDVVLAIGNPFGFGHSASLGIVSGLERYGLQLSAFENYIQTDATIHLGSSGGALIDAEGKLVGINTLIYTGIARTNESSSPELGTCMLKMSVELESTVAHRIHHIYIY